MSVIKKFVQSQLCNLPKPVGNIQYYGNHEAYDGPAFNEQQMQEFAVQMIETFLQIQKEAQRILLQKV